jgi:hypothetical protein
MVASSRFRTAALALIAALLGALFVVLLARDGADAAPSPGANQTRFLLRLVDLPPGYNVFPIGAIGAEGGPAGPDIPCGEIDPVDPAPKLRKFILEYHPSGCFAAYIRGYRVPVPGPYPFLAGTGVLDAGSVVAAEAGFEVAPQLLSHFLFEGEVPAPLPSPSPVGERSMLLHWEGADLFRNGEFGSYLIWRSGSVLGVVLATSRSQAASDRDALALARLQQAHIEHPTPYTAAERDDAEVALDNPKLQRPVYWLGREFAPHNGLPPLRLEGSAADTAGGAHQNVYLYYLRATGKTRSGLNLGVYTREYWRLRGDSLPSPGRCARTKRIALPSGHAILYGAYKGPTPTCPKHPPGVYFARAFIGRSVITADLIATCANCGGPGGGPYNSLKGMAAVVRGIELRPKPLF